jgi:hypothetical protein
MVKFGAGTVTGMVAVSTSAESGTMPTKGTTIVSGATQNFTVAQSETAFYVNQVGVHSTTGFSSVGSIPVSITLTCK